ncbi:hypothetical protein TVAG_079280 [Trichomonas vaginalis G3]|uniref:Uncharacterized protein n=1 Tax=Trichomonas vaginalis (strain ATCC PRA-98 / G3) TaxID=412133 RepID=A2EF60_TRIV3|nr:hypothetical protein TVAGG3_1030000 [Trichomonas vaginalis G3]EAY08670.1 hypothetical protein TVAG_079280 [Trichomonas vaginalis G3]KAI5492787.1 hypothetical protein TVAGG3_1030000 [Trichomonas vaginalis G3]|eukprot:XP_001320893.1 hypothetical protein [Trichomonas vaginalis G3]
MSESTGKHHSHRNDNEEKQKMRIRIKKPREFDENGVPKPHKHVHTHSSRNTQNNDTKFTYAEVSVLPVTTTDLTTLTQNTSTITDTQNNNQKRSHSHKNDSKSRPKERGLPPPENNAPQAKKSHHHKDSSANNKSVDKESTQQTTQQDDKNILSDLGLEAKYSETKIGKRFVKHDTVDDFYDGEAPPPSTVLESRADSTEVSETQQLHGELQRIDFHEYINDPYFYELQKELDYIYNEQLKAAHPELNPTLSQIVGETIDENPRPLYEFEEIHPSKLYPKSTCPAKWRLGYEEPIEVVKREIEEEDMTEVEELISCDPESAEFVDADPWEQNVERYVEQTMTLDPNEDKNDESKEGESLHSMQDVSYEEEAYYYTVTAE